MPYKRSKTDLHNLPRVKGLRIAIRSRLTPAEARMWTILKSSKFDGRKFRRQHSVGRYILDFYSPAERIAIELDGAVHGSGRALHRDGQRRLFLEGSGIRVLRFENRLIFEDEEWVLARIRYEFGWRERDKRTTPSAEAASTPPS